MALIKPEKIPIVKLPMTKVGMKAPAVKPVKLKITPIVGHARPPEMATFERLARVGAVKRPNRMGRY